MLAALVLGGTVLLVPAHSRSEGRSSFILDDNGRVAIEITVGEPDLPELCNADFSVRDRAVEEQKLERCLARDIPLLVRLKADGAACKVAYDAFTADKGVVVIRASAVCPAPPEDTLVVDWGLFGASPLDHVSVAKIEQPHAEPALVMLSKRNTRATVEVKGPLWPKLLAGAGALVVLAAAMAVLVVTRRRRASPSR